MSKVVHCKREPYDVYIGRPSKWGNPFSHQEGTLAQFRVDTREEAVQAYEEWLHTQPHLIAALPELRGKVLGCWCAPKACHGGVLVRLLARLDALGSQAEERATVCDECGSGLLDGEHIADYPCSRRTEEQA